MTTRTLTFTGMKMTADPTVIAVTFDGVAVFSGAVASTELGTLFTHDVAIDDVPTSSIPNPMSNADIPLMTKSHTVSVECVSGGVIIVDVESIPLSATDEAPIIPDPEHYGYPTPDYPAQHEDPKYEVTLNGVPYLIDRQEGSQGAWHCEVPASQTLSFKILVQNLVV